MKQNLTIQPTSNSEKTCNYSSVVDDGSSQSPRTDKRVATQELPRGETDRRLEAALEELKARRAREDDLETKLRELQQRLDETEARPTTAKEQVAAGQGSSKERKGHLDEDIRPWNHS